MATSPQTRAQVLADLATEHRYWQALTDAPEGEREGMLCALIRQRGLAWTLARLGCAEVELASWCSAREIPCRWGPAVREAYRSHLAIECRAGRGRLDVEHAIRLRADGEKLSVIGAMYGVGKTAVINAFRRRREKEETRDPA